MAAPSDLERWARHIVLRDVGGPGQQKIRAARVLVVGAGGLGSPILLYLAAAGIGTIGLVDDDRVSLSNLQRQVIHRLEDVGRLKVESARDAIARLDPGIAVVLHPIRLDAANADAIVAGWDVVVDGVDTLDARFVLADACERARTPLVSSGVLEFYGWLTVLEPWKTGEDGRPNPRFRDVVRRPAQGRQPTCAEVGILGVVPGVLGTLAANEVLKLVVGYGEPLVRRLLSVDLRDVGFDVLDYAAPDPGDGS
ncbi:MAG: HesA/MoeB/ThiF family protein [Hyphomicrobiales bacterium]|nr:HesA/MoeB/ThiF family protein [Hyphomicrobiales bacterium]